MLPILLAASLLLPAGAPRADKWAELVGWTVVETTRIENAAGMGPTIFLRSGKVFDLGTTFGPIVVLAGLDVVVFSRTVSGDELRNTEPDMAKRFPDGRVIYRVLLGDTLYGAERVR